MKKNTETNERDMDADIRERICEMEHPDYQFPGRFQKWDYFIVLAVAVVCLALLIGGYSL